MYILLCQAIHACVHIPLAEMTNDSVINKVFCDCLCILHTYSWLNNTVKVKAIATWSPLRYEMKIRNIPSPGHLSQHLHMTPIYSYRSRSAPNRRPVGVLQEAGAALPTGARCRQHHARLPAEETGRPGAGHPRRSRHRHPAQVRLASLRGQPPWRWVGMDQAGRTTFLIIDLPLMTLKSFTSESMWHKNSSWDELETK